MGIACPPHFYRMVPVDYTIPLPPSNDVNINIVRKCYTIVKGHEYYDQLNCKLKFGESSVPKSYHSNAFSFSSNAVTYGNTNVNMCAGLHGRLFGVRVKNGNDVEQAPGYDQVLRDNQIKFITDFRFIFLCYSKDFDFYNGLCFDERALNLIFAEMPHPKRKLRIQAVMDLINSGRFLEDDWGDKRTRVKLKLYEFAKNNKMPRVIGDLGVGRSIKAPVVMESIKQYMSTTEFRMGNSSCIFVKSVSVDKLHETFSRNYYAGETEWCTRFSVHSDDSSVYISYYETGVLHEMVYNMDISKCDMSHTPELFFLMRDMFQGNTGKMMDNLISQCLCDFDVYSDDMSRKVTFRLLEHKLLSGSVLTTALNTLANYCIFLSFCVHKPRNQLECMRAAEMCGYVVTMGDNLCKEPHLWQFLKYSPVIDINYGIVPVLNLGPLFRRMGNSIGDFIGPTTMSVFERANSHVAAMINSMYGDGVGFGIKCPFLDHLRRQFNNTMIGRHERLLDERIKNIRYHDIDYNRVYIITDEQFFCRYFTDCIGIGDLCDLYDVISNRTYGVNMYSRLADRILELDYGLNVSLLPGGV